MAEASVPLVQDQFICSICLDLLKDPVTINCGHSYCMSCITDCWDQDDQKRVYSCPQCRQTFTPRPVLGKNTMLAEVVEKLKNTKLQAARPDLCYAEPGDVECDVCTERKHKAVKSCLMCLSSYCQNHFERHEELHCGKRHKVTDATGRLQEMICPQHDKLLEIYCRTDQCCICYLCMVDEHKKHDTVSAATERTEKQKQLKDTQSKYQQKIQETQKKLQKLREAVETHKCSAQAAVEDSEKIFTELIRSIERSRSEMIKLIRDQEKAEVSRAEELLKRLEQEIDDLKRRDAELEQLSHTDDPIHFLQSFQSVCVLPGSADSLSFTVSSRLSFNNVAKHVSLLREKMKNFCREDTKHIFDRVMCIEIIPTPKPVTRDQFLRYNRQFTLDPNTMHKHLSEKGRVITNTRRVQRYPYHPDRFDHYPQVLCRESVCGRCYWEVEWSEDVDISVSYKSISRKGEDDESLFGREDQSWSLSCEGSSYSFWHRNKETELPLRASSSRIGVYVDHSSGTLSFYRVSKTVTLIHRVHTTFTQPLYPGFRVCEGSKIKLCDVA